MRTAFVTGAAGFVGRHLVDRLQQQGWSVIAFCRPTDRFDLLPTGVEVRHGDLADRASVEAALPSGVDTVFHLAANTTTWAKNRKAQFRDNVDGTRNVLDVAIARRVRRFIDTSSVSAYGWQPGVVLCENTPSNVAVKGDNYGKSKRAAEALITEATRAGRISAVVLNPVNVIGAGDTANWSQQLIVPISKGELRIIPPGSATWISVHDLVSAEVAAADSVLEGRVLLGGVEASFLDVVNEIQRILGRPVSSRSASRLTVTVVFLATEVLAAATRTEPKLTLAKYRRAVGNLLVDDTLARRELGLGRTSLRDMLQESVAWLKTVGVLPADAAPESDRNGASEGRR